MVVDSRREGNWIYYRLARQSDDGCRRLIRALVAGYAGDPALRRDDGAATKLEGPDRMPIALSKRAAAEGVGTTILLVTVVGSGIAWENGSPAGTSPSPCSRTASRPERAWSL